MSNRSTTNRVDQRPRDSKESRIREGSPEAFEVLDGDGDEFSAPPLHGKVHPAHEMGFIVPTSDDEIRNEHHHPQDAASVGFDADPDAGDAAADLASDLGAQFLEGATYAEDMSERAIRDAEIAENDLPFLVEDEEPISELVLDEDEDEDEEAREAEESEEQPSPSPLATEEPVAPPRRRRRAA